MLGAQWYNRASARGWTYWLEGVTGGLDPSPLAPLGTTAREGRAIKILDTHAVAAELGIDARALRRFLRQHKSYENVGMGGRYVFTSADLPGLRHNLKASGKAPVPKPPTVEECSLDEDPGMSPEVLELIMKHPFYREKFRRYRRQARALRQQRLVLRMRQVLPERYDDERAIEP